MKPAQPRARQSCTRMSFAGAPLPGEAANGATHPYVHHGDMTAIAGDTKPAACWQAGAPTSVGSPRGATSGVENGHERFSFHSRGYCRSVFTRHGCRMPPRLSRSACMAPCKAIREFHIQWVGPDRMVRRDGGACYGSRHHCHNCKSARYRKLGAPRHSAARHEHAQREDPASVTTCGVRW